MWLILIAAFFVGASPDAVAQALAFEAAHDDARATAVLMDALTRDPSWSLARLELGRLLLKTGGDAERVFHHLDLVRSLVPENPRAHYFFALAADELGQTEVAEGALNVALSLRADFAEAELRRAALLETRGQLGEAIQTYGAFVHRHPDDVRVRFRLVAALERASELKGAERELRALTHVKSARVLATRQLIDLYERTGRHREAQALDGAKAKPRAMRPLRPSRK